MFRREWNVFVWAVFTVAIAFLPRAAPPWTRRTHVSYPTPAITEGKIAFVYADDIWVASSDGENPRRVTSHPGEERNPFFAPMASTSRSQPATTATWTST